MNLEDKIKTINHIEDKVGYEHNLFTDNRDLTDLIINCYKYLNNAKLCAYSLDIATNKELWFCNAQNHLYKTRKSNKNVTLDDIEENRPPERLSAAGSSASGFCTPAGARKPRRCRSRNARRDACPARSLKRR